jgi:20S proteasome subunit alpha 2
MCSLRRNLITRHGPLSNLTYTLISAKNGVVIATEKKAPSPLVDDSSLEKVAIICPNIGFVYAGMGPDYRVLVAKARKIAQSYWKVYGEYPPVKVLVSDVAAVMQKATQSGSVKESLICQGVDKLIYRLLLQRSATLWNFATCCWMG